MARKEEYTRIDEALDDLVAREDIGPVGPTFKDAVDAVLAVCHKADLGTGSTTSKQVRDALWEVLEHAG